jgi:hypothetical protein
MWPDPGFDTDLNRGRPPGAAVPVNLSRQVNSVQSSLILQSILTRPHCGFAAVEVMPTDACIVFHECAGCHALLRPEPSDCCVFCSFGSVKCPPMQQSRSCCASAS